MMLLTGWKKGKERIGSMSLLACQDALIRRMGPMNWANKIIIPPLEGDMVLVFHSVGHRLGVFRPESLLRLSLYIFDEHIEYYSHLITLE